MNVDIVIVTFNHEKYIEKCLDSVFMQQTKHNVYVHIYDDASTDRTNEIIEQKILETTFHINYTKRQQNLGINKNYFDVLNACKSDVIMFCEGDDYWVLDSKVDKYVDELNFNTETKGYFSDVNYVSIQNQNIGRSNVRQSTISCSDIIKNNTIPGLSSFGVKNNLSLDKHTWFRDCATPDSLIYILATIDGGIIRKSNEIFSSYRLGSGVWSSSDSTKNLERNIKTFQIVKTNLSKYPLYTAIVASRISSISFELGLKYFKTKNYDQFNKYYSLFTKNYKNNTKNLIKKLIMRSLHLFIKS